MSFEPKILGFLCTWCSYSGADLAGTSRLKLDPCVRVIRVMCSGRVDPAFIIKALCDGADGVLIAGCHPGDCHYQSGNIKTMRRIPLLQRLLAQHGIEPARVRLEWISASEADRYRAVTNDFVRTIRALGPLSPGLPAGSRADAKGMQPGEERVHGE